MRRLSILSRLALVACSSKTAPEAAALYNMQATDGFKFRGAVAIADQEVLTAFDLVPKGVKTATLIDGQGTGYGTVVLHISPESAVGGPLAAVQNGDEIRLDVENRKLELLIDETELARRLGQFKARAPHYDRGYGRLFIDTVLQADQGCDFGFLVRSEKKDDDGDFAPGTRAADKLPLAF